jgi:hypothetical protein
MAGGTTGGFYGQTAGPTTLYDTSGGAVCSSGVTGLATLDSGVALASPAFIIEDPTTSVIALGIVADPSVVDAN